MQKKIEYKDNPRVIQGRQPSYPFKRHRKYHSYLKRKDTSMKPLYCPFPNTHTINDILNSLKLAYYKRELTSNDNYNEVKHGETFYSTKYIYAHLTTYDQSVLSGCESMQKYKESIYSNMYVHTNLINHLIAKVNHCNYVFHIFVEVCIYILDQDGELVSLSPLQEGKKKYPRRNFR